jgi:hypothetical protein
MDMVVLTGVCLVALGLAAWFAVRWGGLEVRRLPFPSGEQQPPSGRDAVLRYLRNVCIAAVAGTVAGVSVLGLGGRLAMRITAATSDDGVQGSLTEAEETVGEITTGGTVGLVVFIGVFGGVVGGMVYMAVRRWLPGPSWCAGLLVGLLGLAVFGRLAALDPDSIDFRILSPRWLAVLLFVALPPLFGIVLSAIVERLDRVYPLLAARPRPAAAYIPVLLLVLVPPLLVAVALGALVALFAPRLRGLYRAWRSSTTQRAGQVVLGAIGVTGLVWLGAGIADILV